MPDRSDSAPLIAALGLVTAWSDEAPDAWLALTGAVESWEAWSDTAAGLAQLAHLLAAQLAAARGCTTQDLIRRLATDLAQDEAGGDFAPGRSRRRLRLLKPARNDL